MENYIIEGTITELSFDEGYFTVCGSEGFAIKRDDKKYNVLCPEKMPEEKTCIGSFITDQKCKFSTSVKHRTALLTSLTSEKRIRVSIDEEELKKSADKENILPVSSITLLSD